MSRADLAVLRRAAEMGRDEAQLVASLNRARARSRAVARPRGGVMLANFAFLIAAGISALLIRPGS
jgi:hypothetical protein